jgi:hypothetical protein
VALGPLSRPEGSNTKKPLTWPRAKGVMRPDRGRSHKPGRKPSQKEEAIFMPTGAAAVAGRILINQFRSAVVRSD